MESTTPRNATAAAALQKLFEFTYNVTKQNVDGFDHEDSLKQPVAAGNCLNWVVGHIVATRNSILKLLGEQPLWNEEEGKPYARGSAPITGGSQAFTSTAIPADAGRAARPAIVSSSAEIDRRPPAW